MSSFKRFPAWLEIVLLVGLATIFAVTYWQYKDSQTIFENHKQETKQPPL